MVNFYDEEEEENYLSEKMASEELKEVYNLLSKKLNTKTKNELEYLRKRNAELEKEVTDTDLKNQRYYNVCAFLFADKELANEIVDYLSKEEV